jgi:hypothetical protein
MNTDANSTAVVADLAAHCRARYGSFTPYGLTTQAMAVVDADTPLVPVTVTTRNPPGLQEAIDAHGGLPLPESLPINHPGNDAWAIVWQPSTGLYAELYQVSAPDEATGGRTVHYGGLCDLVPPAPSGRPDWTRMAALSQDGRQRIPPCFAPGCWAGDRSWAKWAWGISASRVAMMACSVTADDFDAALNRGVPITDKCVALALGDYAHRSVGWNFPAQGSDGSRLDSPPSPMIGDRLKLPAGYGVAGISSSQARALALGCVDGVGPGIIVRERTHAQPQFLFTADRRWTLLVPSPREMFAGFPWEDLNLVRRNARTVAKRQ